MAAVICAISLWLINWLWDNHSLVDSLLSGIALAMAILPEEFPVILTVFLALGAWRISKTERPYAPCVRRSRRWGRSRFLRWTRPAP